MKEKAKEKINKKEQSCSTCQNLSCRVETKEKIGVDKDGHPIGYNCIGYINHNKTL